MPENLANLQRETQNQFATALALETLDGEIMFLLTDELNSR